MPLKETKPDVILLSYAKQSLVLGSREQKRMLQYATALGSLTIIVFTRRREQLPTIFTSAGLTVYGTNSRTKVGMLVRMIFLTVRSLQRSKSVPVLSSQDPFITGWIGYIVSRWYRVRRHIELHGDFFNYPSAHKKNIFSVKYFLTTYLLKKADSIRVVSQRIKKSLIQRGVKAERITVLPIAVDIKKFLLCKRTVDLEQCTFIFVGRLAPEKNVDRIIDAFILAVKKYPNIHLRIVGTGPLELVLKKKVLNAGMDMYITFVPWTQSIEHEYEKADVFVLASEYEGYALVLIEAMAAGLALISTDVGCVGEVARDGEEVLVVEHNIKSLLQAIEIMTDNQEYRERLQAASRERAAAVSLDATEYTKRWIGALQIT